MTPSWDEILHPRTRTGMFAEKAGSAPEGDLNDEALRHIPVRRRKEVAAELQTVRDELERVKGRERALKAQFAASVVADHVPHARRIIIGAGSFPIVFDGDEKRIDNVDHDTQWALMNSFAQAGVAGDFRL